MSLWELSAGDLLDRAASGDPTPGGGSVAAIAGALGLGLVCMALEITARHKQAPPDAAPLLEQVQTLLARLKTHPDADVTAFEGYMAALALPKADDAQKSVRGQAVQASGLVATQAPLTAARDLLAALRLAGQAATLAHRNIVSDVGAGAHLIGAALQATLLNVDINLSSLPEHQRASALQDRQLLATEGKRLTAQVTAAVSERFNA